ncbi:MAG TPA: enoyl-CoA hydratase [Phenylobacterium sp.]
MTEQVIVTLEKGVQVLTLNRPDKKNALNGEMYHALADGLDRAERDPNIRVTLITGTGGSFTSGTDVGIFAEANSTPLDPAEPGNPFPPRLMTVEKPVVAAVNGLAVGIGVTMLLHCDLVYAAKSATFQTPFVKLGLVPELGSSLLLPRLVGLQKATELFLMAKKITAEQAQAMGLVAEVFPDDELLGEALARAQALAAMPPNAVKVTKALLKDPDRQFVAAQVDAEDAHFFPRLRSAEAKEAFSAFFEKRPADFSKVS